MSAPPASSACLDDATIADLAEGRLSKEARASVDEHLARCTDCRQLVSEFARGAAQPETCEPAASRADQSVLPGGAEQLAPGAQLGRYVVLSRVGMGGLGVVYAAYDPELDRRIAVKLLRPDGGERDRSQGRERLLREAKALAKLSHRNVVAVHDVGVLEQRVFIAMEFVAGSTLREWLSEQPRSWREVVEVFREAGRGLVAAHDAGLVHRDFKPDNVLVRTDGHVCVTDFGLARAALTTTARDDPARSVDPAGTTPTLTQTGELVGTPAYMAPEQLTGGPVDATTDQFAFSVALFEALYGVRPFSGVTLGQLTDAVTRGRPRNVDPRDVPAWLDRAVRRGLAVAPGDRFPTMRAMNEALAPPASPSRERRRWLAGGALALMALVAGSVVATLRGRPAAPAPLCRGGAEKLDGVWGGPQRLQAEQAFRATAVPYAGAALGAVEHNLDDFAQRWAAQYTDSCEATRVRGEQSEQLLDARMVCLEQRRKDARALVGAYAHADVAAVQKSAAATEELLSGLAQCETGALVAAPRLPSDADARATIDAVQEQLASVNALRTEGRYREGLDAAQRAVDAAKASGWAPLLADAWYRLADLRIIASDFDGARQSGIEASFTAMDANMNELATQAWTRLVVVATRSEKYPDGELYARLAHVTLGRGASNPRLEGTLAAEEAMLQVGEKHFEQALADVDRAVELTADGAGTTSMEHGNALQVRVDVLLDVGRYEEALTEARRAYDLQVALNGADHPRTARALGSLGNCLLNLGRHEEALEAARGALSILETTHGPTHPVVATALWNMAESQIALGRYDEARSNVERAIAIREGTPGQPELSASLEQRSEIERVQGDLAGAERSARRALALAEADSDDLNVADSLDQLGRVARARGRIDEALRAHRRAVAIGEHGPDPALLARHLTELAEALTAAGSSREAKEVAAHALHLFEADPGDPRYAAGARAVLAR